MKNSYIIYIFVFFLSSCISTNQVFFSDPNYLKSDEFSSTETIIEAYSENDSSIEDSTVKNEEYNSYNDNYYDFSYSSRIRRFHRPMMYSHGFYSGFYTDYYWYNPDPFYWGSSIYSGFGWYSPYYSYSPFYSFYSPFYYDYHYSHWHNHGHYGHFGYHNHHNNYAYYNNYNSNNYTYGPRGSLTSNNRSLIKSNVKSRNSWTPGNNKNIITNKYVTKKPSVSNTSKNNSFNNTVKNILGSSIKERSDRKKTSTNRNTYKTKSNYRSNNRSNYKSRSSGFKSSGSKNISRSPKRK